MISYPGFFKAGEFLDLSEAEQTAFASGFIDGLYVGPYFGGPQPNKLVEALSSCIDGMSNVQIAAIIAKSVKENPKAWHKPLPLEALNAVVDACPAMKPK
jgi:hypothetical protein